MAAPLRIALLSYRGKPYCGGQGVYVHHLSKELVALGHHVEVFSGQPYPVLDEQVPLRQLPSLDIFNDHFPGRLPGFWEVKSWADAAEVSSFLTGTFSEPLAFSLRAWQALRRRPGEFDLVHDNQSLGYGLLGVERDRVPVLGTIHHPITVDRQLELAHARTLLERFGKRRWYAFTRMQARVARRLQRILTVSESSRSDISRDQRVPLERMHVVPVGVDTQRFRPLEGVVRQPGRLITTASADVPLKGLQYLLEAVAKLRTEQEVHLTVIGSPRQGGTAHQTIERLGLSDSVEFVSGVSDERIVELYASSQAAVVPSLYEGFSLPAIEAMATATPLVATTGGALPEVAGTSGETCLLVPPADAEALAAMLARVMDDAELAARVGAAGRQRVSSRWSWRHTAEGTVEQYRALLDEWRPPA